MADEIIENLKKNINEEGNSYYQYEVMYNGVLFKIDCYYLKNFKEKTKIGTTQAFYNINKETNPIEFKIVTSTLQKSTIVHELKHMDYYFSRMRGKEFNPKNNEFERINKILINRFTFLTKSAEMILSVLYYTNRNEFESYYNQFYYDLKDLTKGKSQQEKRTIIDKYLNNETCYITFKTLKGGRFDISKGFRNKGDLKLYLDYLNEILERFKRNQSYRFKDKDSFYNRIKSIINKFRRNVDDVNYVNKFNRIVNNNIDHNYKKFSRLYTLIMDEDDKPEQPIQMKNGRVYSNDLLKTFQEGVMSKSYKEILQNIILDIEDICQDLKDYNFKLKWKHPISAFSVYLVIHKYKDLVNPTPFIFNEEVSEVINRISHYLQLNNCGYKIGYSYPYMEDEPLNILTIDINELISELQIKFWLK
jgi:hypothetical protein